MSECCLPVMGPYALGADVWLAQAEMGFEHQINPSANIVVKLADLDEGRRGGTTVRHVGTAHTITVKLASGTTLATLSAGETSSPIATADGFAVDESSSSGMVTSL